MFTFGKPLKQVSRNARHGEGEGYPLFVPGVLQMKKTLAVLFVISGILLMLYPKINQLISMYKQNQLLKQWDQQAAAKNTRSEESYKKLDQIFLNSPNDVDPSTVNTDKINGKQMIGVIKIKKINLKLPILEGASLDHLKIAAGHLEGTVLPGESGNSTIAAHRSRSYGIMFNRLNEIKPGDEIQITDNKQTYTYRVYETGMVNPSNLSVLKGNGEEKILTLITCDTTGTRRLIIHAKY